MAGEMMETADKTAPSTAITEKRANKLGGCVGIFFQLFDWNRRFANKKLFSRKYLLPGKQVSKRFGGDEKMPKSKPNLIADENRGGFPKSKRNEILESRKHDMKPPSLVARLMGLESMPSSIHRDKPKKKSSFSRNDTSVGKCNEASYSEEDESGCRKSRPQKIQKITTSYGSEALHLKNVLTHVRKHHQNKHQFQKLASPVRSPRPHKRSSRLVDVASRILEPGSQAKRSMKSAMMYEKIRKDPMEISCDVFESRHSYNLASCKNCGSLVDVPVCESSSCDKNKSRMIWRNQDLDLITKKSRSNGKHHLDKTAPSKRACSSPVAPLGYKDKNFVVPMNSSKSEDLTKPCPARKRRIACVNEPDKGIVFTSPTSRKLSVGGYDGLCMKGIRGCYDKGEERKGLRRVSDKTGGRHSKRSDQKMMPLDTDVLGLLLHKKVKELASQHEDERASASSILQELISSLALNRPFVCNAGVDYAGKVYRRLGKAEVRNDHYTSPGCVLDASFSNGTRFSSRLDNSLPEIANIVNHVTRVLDNLNSMDLITNRSRFINARDIIVQTELLFGTQEGFFICPNLLDELMVRAAQSEKLVELPGITGVLLVDAMVEYLELRFYGNFFSGFKIRRMLFPMRINSDGFIREVVEEIIKWTEMAGMDLEEIISVEMEEDKWEEFEIHAYEIGTEIALEILCCLVCELIVDLGKCLPEYHF